MKISKDILRIAQGFWKFLKDFADFKDHEGWNHWKKLLPAEIRSNEAEVACNIMLVVENGLNALSVI